MIEPFRDASGRTIHSIAGLNKLPEAERIAAYRTLLPDSIFEQVGIDPVNAVDASGQPLFTVKGSSDSSDVVVQLKRDVAARGAAVYIHLADTANYQIIILLFVINDLDAARFDVDLNWKGERTKFGTLDRNVEAEIEAMKAGLAPGQVRRGLRLSRTLVGMFEDFVTRLDHNMFFLEPLAYHTAILFERYGCTYSKGRRKMEWINEGFQQDGELTARLDGSTPFRMPGAEKSVRGRSWAIQDGLLGEPYDDIHMHKRVGKHAGIKTSSDVAW